MTDINAWMDSFREALFDTFGARVRFVGLQGSRGRGEATETSDIDTVVILDELTPADIAAYRAMLSRLPHRELVCGFLSGEAELLAWEPSDLFQFYYDTTPLFGSLDVLLSRIDTAAVERAVLSSACNIYHGCVHNLLHERSAEILKGLYKSAAFALQAIGFLQSGTYTRRLADLLPALLPEDRAVGEIFLRFKSGEIPDLDAASEVLFLWAKKRIKRFD